ncbi:MAG: T9SS type A sorting domain-containing protein [Bacteroidales bacterium]|nr:T9SS type A sorting domain-containing protein [Bacteroidales bacterium]
MYFLTSYSPDHDIDSKNYFKNYDSIPTESIIGLYKLDEMLNVTEAYEYTYPIDTSEFRNEDWYMYRNLYCGYIHIYSAFEDDGHITGVYSKMESASHEEKNDSVFFFKMDFNGNFLLRKGYEAGCGTSIMACKRQQMVKNENGYAVYYRGCPDYHGIVEYYDDDFNYMAKRDVLLPEDYSPLLTYGMLDIFSVMRSNHNTTYVCSDFESSTGAYLNDDIRLYEIDDDLNNSTELLPVLNYIERSSPEHDRTAMRSMDMTKDGGIYFTYTLNCGFFDDKDSWIIIEKLDSDFDTIATFFYNEVGVYSKATCITTTKDDGLLLVSYSYDLYNHDDRWSKVTKFPASAFVNIEEAHAHNLKLAVAYPNPGGDIMNIRTGLRNATLQVYDMQGRKVHQQIITDEVTSIDASKWQNGTYVWELRAGNGNGRGNENGILESGKWVKK